MKNNACCLLLLLCCFTFVSCEKEVEADRLQSSGRPFAGIAVLSGILNSSRTLHKDTLYRMEGVVWVAAGDTLTIEPGVRIECTGPQNNTRTPATLIILPGARIECKGTAAEPVVFTAYASKPAPGDWGGILILGQAGGRYAGGSLMKMLSGFNHHADSLVLQSDSAWRYGNNPSDNSGTITYTRIEYAGIPHLISPLTLCGTGSATTLDYVETAWSRNHAFEFRGGNTSASHLISLAPVLEAFSTTMGYRGCLSFSLSLTHARAADSTYIAQPAKTAFEHNNADSGVVFDHLTVIGLPASPPPFYHAQWHGSSNSSGRLSRSTITHSLFLGYLNNTVAVTTSGANISFVSSPQQRSYTENNDSVRLISPWDWADFRPASGSPAARQFPDSIAYKGAFAPDAFSWTGSWARFDY